MKTKAIVALISIFLLITDLIYTTAYAYTPETTDLNRWVAETILFDDEGKDYYRQFLRLHDPVYIELGKAYISDKSLYRTSNMWSDLLNDEYRQNYIIKEYYLYDMILMGFMKYETVSESFITSLQSEEQKIAEQLYSFASDKVVNDTADFLSDKSTIEQAEEFFENAEWAETLGKTLTIMDFGRTAVEDCMDQIACCIALSEKRQDKLELLKASREVAIKDKDSDYVQAVSVIIDALEDINVFDYVKNKGAVQAWDMVLKATEEIVKTKIPALAVLNLSIAGMDVLFKSSNTASNDVKLTFLLLCDSYMRIGAINTAQQYRESLSPEAAGVFLDSFKGYLTFQKYGDDFAKKWINDYISAREKVFTWLFNRNNVKKAKKLYDFCDSEITERDKLLNKVSELYIIYTIPQQTSQKDTHKYDDQDYIDSSTSKLIAPFLGEGWQCHTMWPDPNGDVNKYVPYYRATVFEDHIETVYYDGSSKTDVIHSVESDGDGVIIKLENGFAFHAPSKDSSTLWLYGDWEIRDDNMYGADSMSRTRDESSSHNKNFQDANMTIIDASDCFGMTAEEAADYMGMMEHSEMPDEYYSYYTHEGETYMDNGSYIYYEPDNKDVEDWWDLRIQDSSVSFYGITIGTSEKKAMEILDHHGWNYYEDYSDYEPENGEGSFAFFRSDKFEDMKRLYIEFLNGKVVNISFSINVDGD